MRVPDWSKRLSAVLTTSVGRELVWGRHDCFTFAGKVAEALTGFDPTAVLHGQYDDYASGLRAARAQLGVVGLRGFGDRYYQLTAMAMARRGDWAMVRAPDGWALAIVDGGALRNAWGVIVPLAEARACWRVE